MCDVGTAVVAGLQVGGALFGANAAKNRGEANARYYAQLADQTEAQGALVDQTTDANQKLVMDQAAREATKVRQQGKLVDSSQRARMAANGVTSGATAEDIARDTLDKQQLDEMAIRYSANLQNWELDNDRKFKKYDLAQKAYQYRMAGRYGVEAANIDATSTLLGGAAQAGSTWLNYRNSR